MKKSFAIVAVVCALTGTASAQDDVEGGTDATEETTTETTEVSTETTTTTSNTTTTEGGAAGAGHQYGIEAAFNAAADEPAVHLLYNLGGNYLDLGLGLAVESEAETAWNLELELGYRMMRTMVGRVQPYIKPLVVLAIADTGVEGSDTLLSFGAGAAFGVDYELFPQFTLGTEVGGAIVYTNTDPDATIAFELTTAALKATFWW
jgi:hypothetical protein